MLLELSVNNFAIIERMHIAFSPGFNVLTGETGAGKSILIDAVSALLGGRCGPELVRGGSDAARVEGIFARTPAMAEIDAASLSTLLEEFGVCGDEETIILSREIQRGGRTVARVNGRAVPVGVLQQAGRALVDIHGQGDHLSLLRVSQHVDLVDRYAGLLDRRLQVAAGVAELRLVQKEIDSLLRDEREIARRVDLLRFQVDEIQAAALRAGEEEELAAERVLLNSAEQLSSGADEAFRLLQGEGDERGVLDTLGEALLQVERLARVDLTLAEQRRLLEESSYQLADVATAIRRYRDNVEFNPVRLEAIEERLDTILRMKRKYGSTIAEILRFGSTASAELDAITHGEERLAELKAREETLKVTLGAEAETLSLTRQRAAEELAAAVEGELADLNMPKTRFKVAFGRSAESTGLPLSDGACYSYDATGIDRVEFLIAPNPGEPLRPLVKIASGGETARLMLALKTILTRADAVPTLIFDEIDVGIGGRSGQMVGRKLWNLTAEHQVLCVTHLPQIACFADRHFQISKLLAGDRATTAVQDLAGDSRVSELAVMLGGIEDSASAHENARDLLARAEQGRRERAVVRGERA